MYKVDIIHHVDFQLNRLLISPFFFLHAFLGLDFSSKLQNFGHFIKIKFPL